MGMVVFKLKGDNVMTEKLLKKLNSSGKMHAVPCMIKGQYVIRFTVTSQRTTVQVSSGVEVVLKKDELCQFKFQSSLSFSATPQ